MEHLGRQRKSKKINTGYNQKRGCLRVFLCGIISWGFRPKPGRKGLFGKSPLESQKLRQSEVVCLVRKFCGFLRSFFKSSLKQGLERSSNTLRKIKNAAMPCFLRALSVEAIRPKPRPKKLFGKSFLELQKLFQNKAVCSVGNSLAYLSYKKGKSFFITATAKTYDEKRSNTKFIPL